MEADMTGQSLERNDGWEERVKELCKAENFSCRIAPCDIPFTSLSDEEWSRLRTKLLLIEQFACFMAAGMLKGTIKYPTDTWKERWQPNLFGETADMVNYLMLTLTSLEEK